MSYRAWAVIFSLVSFAVSTTGLETVLSIAGPIIGFLYPSAITLVLLTLLEPLLPVRLHYGFRFALTVSVVWAALMSLSDIGLSFLVTCPRPATRLGRPHAGARRRGLCGGYGAQERNH